MCPAAVLILFIFLSTSIITMRAIFTVSTTFSYITVIIDIHLSDLIAIIFKKIAPSSFNIHDYLLRILPFLTTILSGSGSCPVYSSTASTVTLL